MRMRKVNGFLILALACAVVGPVPTQGAEMLENLRSIYDRALKKIETDHADTVRERPARYRATLDAAMRAFQKQGNLNGVLSVKAETTRFDQAGTVPDKPDAKTPHTIARLQTDWYENNAQADLAKNKRLVDLAEKYIARLDALKRERTIQGRFDDAVNAHKEIDRVRNSPAMTAAQFAVALTEREADKAFDEKPDKPPPTTPVPPPSPPAVERDSAACPNCAGTGQISVDCPSCRGTGQCSNCQGQGRRRSGFRGSSAMVGCISCKTTGQCRACEGTGKRTRACPDCKN